LEVNPVVGPVYVEDASEGDLLAVHIYGIRLTRDVATSELIPNFGSLTGEWSGHTLFFNDPVPSILYEWRLDLARNVGILELPGSRLQRVEVPLAPFIGTIAWRFMYGQVETTLRPASTAAT
jgi:acetamidase/formamidase